MIHNASIEKYRTPVGAVTCGSEMTIRLYETGESVSKAEIIMYSETFHREYEMKRKKAEEIAKELTNHGRWRSHGRSLKIDDLESIGLRIKRLDEDETLAEIVYRIQTIIRLIFSSGTNYKIIATENDRLFKQAISAGMTRPHPRNEIDLLEIDVQCQKCGRSHKIYAKFVNKAQIDIDYKKKGIPPFPKDNKLICDCGFEMDLSGIQKDVESRMPDITRYLRGSQIRQKNCVIAQCLAPVKTHVIQCYA